jgi:hypothetical protein
MNQHLTLACILTLAVSFTIINLLLANVFGWGLTFIVLADGLLYIALNYLLNVYIRRQHKETFV